MEQVIRWAEDRRAITFSDDLGGVLELADELEMDELFDIAAQCINDTLQEAGSIGASTRELIDSMAAPVALRLLDHLEPASFELLRTKIPPYTHQYKRQLEKLLYRSHFARNLPSHLVKQTYHTVVQLQICVSDQMQYGTCELDIRTRVDKAECSNTRYLFTLERVVERLTVWDLLQRPFARVGVCEGVVDATFGPSNVLLTLEIDRHIHVRTVSGVQVAAVPCGSANALSASSDCLLAFTTLPLPQPPSFSPSNSYMWRWSPKMTAVHMQTVDSFTTACLSPDGEFMVRSFRGAVWSSPVEHDDERHHRVFTQPDDNTYGQLGDVMALAVSEDGSTIAAVYASVVAFWWIGDCASSQSLDIGCTFHEAFGHLAFSPDARRIALGTWEGSVILYAQDNGCYRLESRSRIGKAILHLNWAKDGRFLVVSSYGGVMFWNLQ